MGGWGGSAGLVVVCLVKAGWSLSSERGFADLDLPAELNMVEAPPIGIDPVCGMKGAAGRCGAGGRTGGGCWGGAGVSGL